LATALVRQTQGTHRKDKEAQQKNANGIPKGKEDELYKWNTKRNTALTICALVAAGFSTVFRAPFRRFRRY